MSVYHSFKPVKLFETEKKSHMFYKCKSEEWQTKNPATRYIFKIMLESVYPREIFGAPKYYAMYGTWKGKEILIAAGDSKEELKTAILRFRDNHCFWFNLGRHAYTAYQEWINKDF